MLIEPRTLATQPLEYTGAVQKHGCSSREDVEILRWMLSTKLNARMESEATP